MTTTVTMPERGHFTGRRQIPADVVTLDFVDGVAVHDEPLPTAIRQQLEADGFQVQEVAA